MRTDVPSLLTRRRLAVLGAAAAGTALASGLIVPDAYAATTYDLGSATLKQGSRGTYVKNLQKALNSIMRAGLTVDGVFGSGTTRAVKAFQSSRHLTADGKVGPGTKKALNSGAAAPSGSTSTPKSSGGSYYVPQDSHTTSFSGAGSTLKYSTSGTAVVNGTRVRYLWESMRAFGYVSSIPRTSSMTFNATLSAAVKKFQTAQRLKADGVVGKQTWNAITARRGSTIPFTWDSYIAPTEATARGGSADDRIRAMKRYFDRFVGRSPYTWGGMGASVASAGFDCSGLVWQMVAAGGIVIASTDPKRHAQKSFRSTQAMYSDTRLRRYPLSQRRTGDIITFASRSRRALSDVCHDGIFYEGRLLESYGPGVVSTAWNGGDIHRDGYTRYVMPYVKRPFA